jgi:hypothetical protein
MRCSVPAVVSVAVELHQNSNQGIGGDAVNCTPPQTRFRISVLPNSGRFKEGPAQAIAAWNSCSALNGCVGGNSTSDIRLLDG